MADIGGIKDARHLSTSYRHSEHTSNGEGGLTDAMASERSVVASCSPRRS
jgi:hypothetical protein